MAVDHDRGDRGGEPGTPLQLDKSSAQAGEQVHIRLVGPAGGVASVDVVPLGGPGAEFAREGPQGERA